MADTLTLPAFGAELDPKLEILAKDEEWDDEDEWEEDEDEDEEEDEDEISAQI